MRRLLIITLTFLCNFAQADIAGEFDYYVLALSWTPNWCAREGDARGSAQCDPDQGFGWTLHGLWPQYERGYPQDCAAPASLDPTRQQSALMADIMGSGGLAFYQWRKHGRCSGLSGSAYYAASRAAYEAVTRPPVLRQLPRALKIPASVVEEAFLQSNPDLAPDMLTITCRDGYIQEARLCLTKELARRRCGSDVIRDCSAKDAVMTPIR